MTRILPDDLEHGIATRAVHAGQEPDPKAGAVMPPIYQTSTYVMEGLGRHKGYDYARTANPTREAYERNVASLEGGTHGLAYGSGLAALDAVLKLLKAGDHVISEANIYGGSGRMMREFYAPLGLEFSFVDTRDIASVEAELRPETRLVFSETPTNPMMRLTDLAALGDLTQAHGLLFVVDNTFATPIFQQPLRYGADLVLHSTTKYINGHSDMLGGMLVCDRDDLAERLAFIQMAAGAVPGPMDCWLALRGAKTLPLRMQQHDATGRTIAKWLEQRPDVPSVFYPGLESHPQYDLACRQMSGFGGMISFDLGDPERTKRFVEGTKIFSLAESLGGVESLVNHPASMTHASVPVAMREEMGLTDSLVRLSCGIENVEDLLADIEQALDAAG